MLASAQGSLLFSLELPLPAEDAGPRFPRRTDMDPFKVAQRLELLCRASCPFARELRCAVENIFSEVGREGSLSADELANRVAWRGYSVVVRTALSGVGADCFKSLRHQFLVVHGSGDYVGIEFIVEPSLRQHFAIPHPSPEYAFLLSRTPDVFVGGSCRLVPIIQTLCKHMAESFALHCRPLPPWRREPAMLSKWLPHPTRFTDVKCPTLALGTGPHPTTNPPRVVPRSQPSERGGCGPAAALPMHGWTWLDGAATPTDVCRTDSDSSNVSSVGGISFAMGCSPVSVLPTAPSGEGNPGPGTGAAAEVEAGEGRFPFSLAAVCAVRGFDSPTPVAADATAAAAATAAVAATPFRSRSLGLSQSPIGKAAVSTILIGPQERGPKQGQQQQQEQPLLLLLQPRADLKQSELDTGATARRDLLLFGGREDPPGGGGCSSGGRAGLLSVQLHQLQLRHLGSSNRCNSADPEGTQPQPPGQEVEAHRIRMRPPAYRGEMAIRVVKLVGINATAAAATAGSEPPSTAAVAGASQYHSNHSGSSS